MHVLKNVCEGVFFVGFFFHFSALANCVVLQNFVVCVYTHIAVCIHTNFAQQDVKVRLELLLSFY